MSKQHYDVTFFFRIIIGQFTIIDCLSQSTNYEVKYNPKYIYMSVIESNWIEVSQLQGMSKHLWNIIIFKSQKYIFNILTLIIK